MSNIKGKQGQCLIKRRLDGSTPKKSNTDNVPEDLVEFLTQLKDFTSLGSKLCIPNAIQKHILRGWKWNTLESYKGGVRKFLKFIRERGDKEFTLPAEKEASYEFCLWAGCTYQSPNPQDIGAKTLYHDKLYPEVDEKRVELMLISSSKEDSLIEKGPTQNAVELKHLLPLATELVDKTAKDLAIFDTICIAFWGMARISKLTYSKKEGSLDWRDSILVENVSLYDREKKATIKVRCAKMCKPGEFQILYL
ncbi:hypothetical protein CROQUDRAFT_133283 [Cronartium quercuum f. sp. fusiforme G11]|uniref:Core-binding (CB) domain-containing protein n=1 Tax=Cronartium quercuum f. sp. fusiforme G11 TaxID=708437 RepID=A0A9P6TBF5_9BASI|nr:hypothetical protein CROQUDRAFT_133283 [Cronartium quercuum f. sp. fusiforme G11]